MVYCIKLKNCDARLRECDSECEIRPPCFTVIPSLGGTD